MQFQNQDLFNCQEIIAFVTCESPVTKAEILASRIKKYVFMKGTGDAAELFVLRENVLYQIIAGKTNIADTITNYVSKYLSRSYDRCIAKLRELDDYDSKAKRLVAMLSNANISTYLIQLRSELKNDKIVFDNYINQLHFLNGYLNLNNGEFIKREFGIDYVSYAIPREYKRSSETSRKRLRGILRKTYPMNEDYQNAISEIAKCLKGDPYEFTDTMFFVGKGSTGKTFLLELTEISICEYVQPMPSNTFEKGNQKADKLMNQFLNRGYIRVAIVNEFSAGTIDAPLFKTFADGKVQTTILYQDGIVTVKIKAKMVCASNDLPKFIVDTGMKRRFNSLRHTSEFVKIPSLVDEANHKYLVDVGLMKEIEHNEDLQNAWIDIITEFSIKLYNKVPVPHSVNMQETTNELVDSNDIMQDFIDQCLVTSKYDKDRISKDDMLDMYLKIYPTKRITSGQLMTALRDKDFVYEAQRRASNNVRGCYLYVKWRNEEQAIDYDEGVDKTSKSVNVNLILQTERNVAIKQNIKLKHELVIASYVNEILMHRLTKKTKIHDKLNKTFNALKLWRDDIVIAQQNSNKHEQIDIRTSSEDVLKARKVQKKTLTGLLW